LRMSKNLFENLVNLVADNVYKVVDKTVGEVVKKLNPIQSIQEEKEQVRERSEFKGKFQEKVEENIIKRVKSGDVILFEGFGEERKTELRMMSGEDILNSFKVDNNFLWSFSEGPTAKNVENAKIIKNAIVSSSVILTNQMIGDKPSIEELNNKNLQEEIKCIKCSIKKLELNLRLTNEDTIKDDEFLTLLTEISGLCGPVSGEMDCKTNLQEFVDEVILKRDMNSIAGLIKMASFMCPILAFANKNLFSDLAASAASGTAVVQVEGIEGKTIGICSKIIGYITRSGNEGVVTIDDTKSEIEFLNDAHEMGVIEGIVSFVGIGGANKEGDIEKKISSSIRSVVRRTVVNTIETVLKYATFYQKTICMVFITLLSTHIYLSLYKGGNETDTENYYKSSIELFYNNMTNESMKIGFGNETITGVNGGKKASKSRRAANAVSKAIAKVAAAKPKAAKAPTNATAKPTTKPTTKPIAKPTAKAAAANATASAKKKK